MKIKTTEWNYGIHYKQSGYNIELFIDIDGDLKFIGTVDLKNNDHEKLTSPVSKIGSALKDIYLGDNEQEIYQELKDFLYKRKLYAENRESPEQQEEPEPEEVKADLSVKTYEDLKEVVVKYLGEKYENAFRKLLVNVVSNWFADTESLYMIILAGANSGKTTLCSCFEYCDSTFHTDNLTPHALDAGGAASDQESWNVLDNTEDKTLITHDLTSLFNDNEKVVHRIHGIFENVYGDHTYRKSSPGFGNKEYGGQMNLIFGITPFVFWDKNNFEKHSKGIRMIHSQRYLYILLPERDQIKDFVEGRILNREMKEEIKLKTAGFIKNLKDNLDNFSVQVDEDVRDMIADEMLDTFEYINRNREKALNLRETFTRRAKQCIMYCKTLCFILGEEKITRDMIKDFCEMLILFDE